jgi:hypothetical protein
MRHGRTPPRNGRAQLLRLTPQGRAIAREATRCDLLLEVFAAFNSGWNVPCGYKPSVRMPEQSRLAMTPSRSAEKPFPQCKKRKKVCCGTPQWQGKSGSPIGRRQRGSGLHLLPETARVFAEML